MTNLITEHEYRTFQRAYSFFNGKLFANSLPDLLVTLQRHAGAKGYFAPERFKGRVENENEKITAHELALNPDVFTGRSDEAILSTLVHEMVHVWQETHGTPPRRSYHDRQWARKMKEIGLQPSTTGEPGGKETGQSVTHYILPAGRFADAYAELAASGFRINWQSVPFNGRERKKKAASKTRYTCPGCGTNAWAKPQTKLICGACYEDKGEVTFLQPEVSPDDKQEAD